jgi:hypothetical protein
MASNHRKTSKAKTKAKNAEASTSRKHRREEDSEEDAEIVVSVSSKRRTKKSRTTAVDKSGDEIEVLPSKQKTKQRKTTNEVEPGDDVEEGSKISGNEDEDEGSSLEERHRAPIPKKLNVKGDSVRDILTIFTEWTTVKFSDEGKVEMVTGRWCLICK